MQIAQSTSRIVNSQDEMNARHAVFFMPEHNSSSNEKLISNFAESPSFINLILNGFLPKIERGNGFNLIFSELQYGHDDNVV